VLVPGQLITHVELPVPPAGARSDYRKVRDRASYAFALVSVAAELAVADGEIGSARVALGGIAHKPWRASRAEQVLRGAPPTEEVFAHAADAELADAAPVEGIDGNAFKVELTRRALVSTLRAVAGAAADGRQARQ
jgi:xanthine dehydrogenase YagS FAD-binding subunit